MRFVRICLMLLAFGVATALPAKASIIDFQAALDGSQEVPANGSIGHGFATMTLNNQSLLLSWDITWAWLSSPVIAAHFHAAPAGVNGPVQVPIPLPGPVVGSATISQS